MSFVEFKKWPCRFVELSLGGPVLRFQICNHGRMTFTVALPHATLILRQHCYCPHQACVQHGAVTIRVSTGIVLTRTVYTL